MFEGVGRVNSMTPTGVKQCSLWPFNYEDQNFKLV